MTRAIILMVTLGLFWNVSSQAQQPKNPPPKNKFLELNPGYKERAGSFYEAQYLPGAAANLVRVVEHQNMTPPQATGILRELIYNFLDVMIEGNGEVTRQERAKVVAHIDKRVRDLVKDEAAFQRYLKWRKVRDRKDNPLEFLFNHPQSIQFQLPAKLTDAGWTVDLQTEEEQLQRYRGYFGFDPDMAIQLTNKRMAQGRDKRPTTLTLLVYPQGRVRDLLSGQEPPYRPRQKQGPPLPALHLFWHMHPNIFFQVDGDFGPEHAKAAAAVKHSLLGVGP